jgi:proteasome lid subunit RPN8/RPN11
MPFQMHTVSELPGMIPLPLHITGNFTLHQHPTGDPTPSAEDVSITRRLKDAGSYNSWGWSVSEFCGEGIIVDQSKLKFKMKRLFLEVYLEVCNEYIK